MERVYFISVVTVLEATQHTEILMVDIHRHKRADRLTYCPPAQAHRETDTHHTHTDTQALKNTLPTTERVHTRDKGT